MATEMRVPLRSVANDVYRNGALIATVWNTGAHTDSTGPHGRASFTYRVCEAGTPLLQGCNGALR
jgi:hypothetical protein